MLRLISAACRTHMLHEARGLDYNIVNCVVAVTRCVSIIVEVTDNILTNINRAKCHESKKADAECHTPTQLSR